MLSPPSESLDDDPLELLELEFGAVASASGSSLERFSVEAGAGGWTGGGLWTGVGEVGGTGARKVEDEGGKVEDEDEVATRTVCCSQVLGFFPEGAEEI